MLCNPAIREFRILPPLPCQRRHYSHPYYRHLGFAFDPKANDYKVLKVAPQQEYDPRISAYTHVEERVQIYNMSTDSWREIVAMVPKGTLCDPRHSFSTSLNGVFYFVALAPNACFKIIAFHMFGELFEQGLPCPRYLGPSRAVAGKESLLCMWARYGDRWNKKYSTGPILGSHRALAFQENGELLLLRSKDCRLVSYNLDTQNMKEHHREYGDSTLVEFQVFTENLVSVKRCAY
ncbi:uncharacterized protein LOC131302807 [Rhododendron vialii]|uniref:uncharacterized protein LOC131302807 n=1 Tax=Rhododendron vialii TaxID=182163 RepID=UPI00265ED8F6|nr:uncharacterized protein LOC131302807 [Rhododendron vialii]